MEAALYQPIVLQSYITCQKAGNIVSVCLHQANPDNNLEIRMPYVEGVTHFEVTEGEVVDGKIADDFVAEWKNDVYKINIEIRRNGSCIKVFELNTGVSRCIFGIFLLGYSDPNGIKMTYNFKDAFMDGQGINDFFYVKPGFFNKILDFGKFCNNWTNRTNVHKEYLEIACTSTQANNSYDRMFVKALVRYLFEIQYMPVAEDEAKNRICYSFTENEFIFHYKNSEGEENNLKIVFPYKRQTSVFSFEVNIYYDWDLEGGVIYDECIMEYTHDAYKFTIDLEIGVSGNINFKIHDNFVFFLSAPVCFPLFMINFKADFMNPQGVDFEYYIKPNYLNNKIDFCVFLKNWDEESDFIKDALKEILNSRTCYQNRDTILLLIKFLLDYVCNLNELNVVFCCIFCIFIGYCIYFRITHINNLYIVELDT
jgi:hypothetical protein